MFEDLPNQEIFTGKLPASSDLNKEVQKSWRIRFGSFEKHCYFFKISKWKYTFVRDYMCGKLFSYFLNNAAKTCLYELTISENIENKHVLFQSKHLFISIAITTQVASAPLTNISCYNKYQLILLNVLHD